MKVITSIDQISTDWLTGVLAKSQALLEGAVLSYSTNTGQGNWSTSANLSVTYTQDARGKLPDKLFLKMVDTNLGDGEFFGDSEVLYYTSDYQDVRNAPVLRCYDAAYSPEFHCYHILLEDVSATHIEAAEKVPNLDYGLALAEGLAVLHAHWWGEERLANANAQIHPPQYIQQFVDIAAPGLEPILENFSQDLKPHWPALLREIFEKLPQALIRRPRNIAGFTLIHGDVGCGNVLVPRQGNRPIYIIDRQPFNWSLTTWLGVYDLAYAIALDWDSDLRRQWETLILEHYLANLQINGVRNYTWQQLYDDYRLCVAAGILIAVEYCRGGVNEEWRHVWLPMLKRALTAIDELNCRELI